MSKTVDELIGVYIEASNAVVWEAEKRGLCPMTLDMQRAGIAAVVRAVRDEIDRIWIDEDMGCGTILDVFNQILGAAGNEKVAGVIGLDPVGAGLSPASGQAPATDHCPHCKGEGCTPHLDRKGNVYPEPCQHCETTGRVPATDPAPAVCEWTQEGWEYRTAGCNGWSTHIYSPKYSPPGNKCPHCKRPIKFTEAQR